MFKLTEFYLQNKCTLASSNPCNKNKVCLKFLSYGVIGISQKKSIQPLEREVSWLQICLSLLTALFARKSHTGRITCVCRVSFQGTKSSSQDRQYLKLMKWREKRQNWLFRHSKGKNHWKSKHCSSGLSLINHVARNDPHVGQFLRRDGESSLRESVFHNKARLQSPLDRLGFHLVPPIHIFI